MSGRCGQLGPEAGGVARGVEADGLPTWLEPVREAAERVLPEQLSRFLPPPEGGRPAAVLMLFGEGPEGPDLLLIERARSLRSHAGQPSFPGGVLDPEDGDPNGPGPIAAALREAWEETGLDPAGVQVFAELPRLYIPVSGFVVTPVLGWWREESPVRPVDTAETGAVFRVTIAELADPENRVRLRHPSGHIGPAFTVAGRLVWGFTAGVIDRVMHHSGLELPWDPSRIVDLSDDALALVQGDLEHSRVLSSGDADAS
ncbi:CoA pyrophosphatase [Kitasatospora sp. NPDC005856]|uniref:NUDIX hydrolase n=1 Tax=Kitasatospora sp. NPDC005856 TaxID=3154566 RepID=UPI0033EA388B